MSAAFTRGQHWRVVCMSLAFTPASILREHSPGATSMPRDLQRPYFGFCRLIKTNLLQIHCASSGNVYSRIMCQVDPTAVDMEMSMILTYANLSSPTGPTANFEDILFPASTDSSSEGRAGYIVRCIRVGRDRIILWYSIHFRRSHLEGNLH